MDEKTRDDRPMKKIWIGTNWKMTKTLSEGLTYTEQLLAVSEEIRSEIQLFIIPSFTSLLPIKQAIKGSRILLGAQNMHWEARGAYTGEISPVMLSEIGVDLVELGHSERRQYYNETDEDIRKKVKAALAEGIRPLVCIGESLREKEAGVSGEVVAMQLKTALGGLSPSDAEHMLIAYEPVWSIGENGVPADHHYVGNVHAEIREVLLAMFGVAASMIPILYGGSVNRSNSLQYLGLPDVDGLFIGRSAWEVPSFKAILKDVEGFMKENDKYR
jgi:triosephosphate isomerase